MKKILPVLLAFLVLLTLPVSAAGGKLTATAAESGDKVTVTVRLDNPGIIATRIFVRYDSQVLQLTGAQNGDVFPQGSAVFGKELSDDPYTMLWDESLRRDNNTTSGTLCTLTFDVKGGTPNGTTSVRIAVDKLSTFDVDLNEAVVADCSCSVNVPSTGAAQSSTTTTTTTKAAASSTKATTTAKQSAAVANATTTILTTTKAVPTTTASVQKPGTTAAQQPGTQATKTTAASGQTVTGKMSERLSSAVSAAVSSAAESAREKTTAAGADAPSINDQGTTAAQSGETKLIDPAADEAENVPATGDTTPELLIADDAQSDIAQTQDGTTTVSKSATNRKGLLWLLLLIPIAAVVVFLIVKKKKA